jgi:hypothetical protein
MISKHTSIRALFRLISAFMGNLNSCTRRLGVKAVVQLANAGAFFFYHVRQFLARAWAAFHPVAVASPYPPCPHRLERAEPCRQASPQGFARRFQARRHD